MIYVCMLMPARSGAAAHGVLWSKGGSTCQALDCNSDHRDLCHSRRVIHLSTIRLPSGQRGLERVEWSPAVMLLQRWLHIQQGGELVYQQAQQHPHPLWMLA